MEEQLPQLEALATAVYAAASNEEVDRAKLDPMGPGAPRLHESIGPHVVLGWFCFVRRTSMDAPLPSPDTFS